jgi:copper(I)-binding protein
MTDPTRESGARPVARRQALQGLAALGTGLLLPQARACEFFTSSLRITHPWTRATLPGAEAAIVSMRFDEVTVADRLIGVQTLVAEGAELGGADAAAALDLEIPAGRETLLSEDGVHLRLVGLRMPLHEGRSYPMRLIFAQGGLVNASLSIDFPALR